MVEQIREIVVPGFVTDILDQFEAQPTSFPDWELSGALSDAIRAHEGLPQAERNGWWAEMAAFKFNHLDIQQESCWGTHFGPVTTITDKAGKKHHSPSLEEVGPEIVSHWRCRAKQAKHPILCARYADLVWDLTKVCTKQRPEIEYARIAIDSYVAASQSEPGELLLDQVDRLTRALELALSIEDVARVEAVCNAMFRFYENRILPRAEQGPWCFLFDSVYGNKRIRLNQEQVQSITCWLELCLRRCTNPGDPANFSPWTAKEIALRLARFYQARGKPDDVHRVITVYGNAFVHMAKQADGIIAVPWVQGVYEDYVTFGLKNEAENLLLLSKAKGTEIPTQMGTIKGSVTTTKDELQNIVDAVVVNDPRESIDRIAMNFIPQVADAKEALRRLDEDHPLLAHIGVSVVGEDQIIAKAGSVHDDEEGRLVMQIAQNLSMAWAFLATCLDALRERHRPTADSIVSHLVLSPAFDANRKELLIAGVQAYLDGDFITAIHVLTPQIEHVLRRLLALVGRPTGKHVRSNLGIMQEKSLDDILTDPALQAALPEDVRRYLSVLLADRRGWNVRNRLAHGLMSPENFNRQVADYVFHALLVLGLIRRAE